MNGRAQSRVAEPGETLIAGTERLAPLTILRSFEGCGILQGGRTDACWFILRRADCLLCLCKYYGRRDGQGYRGRSINSTLIIFGS